MKKVGTLNPGSTFGEHALMHRGNLRTATIIAEEKCYLGVLDQCDFNRCMMKNETVKREKMIEFVLKIP
jgi:hypothetical protein